MLDSHRMEGKNLSVLPLPWRTIKNFQSCDSSALGGPCNTSKRSVTGNSEAFLLTVTFSFLNRALLFFTRLCREVQIEKLFKVLQQHVQLHALHVLVDKSLW